LAARHAAGTAPNRGRFKAIDVGIERWAAALKGHHELKSPFMPIACQPALAKNALIYYNFRNS
jgi:hypothetical protein